MGAIVVPSELNKFSKEEVLDWGKSLVTRANTAIGKANLLEEQGSVLGVAVDTGFVLGTAMVATYADARDLLPSIGTAKPGSPQKPDTEVRAHYSKAAAVAVGLLGMAATRKKSPNLFAVSRDVFLGGVVAMGCEYARSKGIAAKIDDAKALAEKKAREAAQPQTKAA